jgi:hypothetical protein
VKKTAIVLAGILMIESTEPARAVNISDLGLAGIAALTEVVLISVGNCLFGMMLQYSAEATGLLYIITNLSILGGGVYVSIKAAKYFEKEKKKERGFREKIGRSGGRSVKNM